MFEPMEEPLLNNLSKKKCKSSGWVSQNSPFSINYSKLPTKLPFQSSFMKMNIIFKQNT